MNKQQFIQRISQETYKICRSFESCYTPEQLETTRVWADGVMDRWNFFVLDWEQCVCDTVTSHVKAANEEMSASYTQMCDVLKQKNEEPKPKPHIIVKGFC